MGTNTAIFGAGCFWGVEAAFREVPGVVEVTSGYAGGVTAEPTYEQVCSGRTGHAEVVRVVFDPDAVSYDALLEVFWSIHDPTTLNRQGPDVGTQYRSVILVGGGDQEGAARDSRDRQQASGRFGRPIVTEIAPATTFWPAEDYHQRYYEKHGLAACRVP